MKKTRAGEGRPGDLRKTAILNKVLMVGLIKIVTPE